MTLPPKPHPEQQEGEVFLSNINKADMRLLERWRTHRLGTQALDIIGEPIEDAAIVPVFVQREEYESRYAAL